MSPPTADYAAVFAALPLPATLIDAAGLIVDVNDAFLESSRRYGYDVTRQERIGRPIWAFASADDPLLSRRAVLGFLRRGDPPTARLRCKDRRGGGSVLQEVRAIVLRDGSGAIIVREEVTEREENARQLQESMRYLEAFARAGRIVLGSLDLEEILDAIPRELVQAGVFRSLMVALVDESRTYIEVRRSFVREVDEHGRVVPNSAIRTTTDTSGRRFRLSEDNPTPRVARSGEMEWLEDEEPRIATPRDGAEPVAAPGTRSRVSFFFPVMKGNRALAVLATAAPAADREVILARIQAMRPLLDQVAIAIEHARLYDRIRASEAAAQTGLRVERVRNAILHMEQDADWKSVVQTLTDQLRRVVDYDGCGINLVCGDRVQSYSEGPGLSASLEEPSVPPPVQRALAEGDVVYRRNQAEMERDGDCPHLLQAGIRSVIDVPFGTGTLALNSRRENAFSSEVIDALRRFAEVVGEGHRRLEDLRLLATREQQLRQAQKMEAIGQLTAGVAHNFNNLLQAIVGHLDLTRIEVEGSTAARSIDKALVATQRASDLVHQLMVYARQSQRREYHSTDPVRIVRDVAAICRRTFDRRIELDVATEAAQGLRTLGDPMQLEQVLLNLCINARDTIEEAQPENPRIGLRVEPVEISAQETPVGIEAGRFLRFQITDNGAGMDARTLRCIFDPFFTTKPVGQGTGLGLSTALSIIEDHGGWLRCDSEPGAGTVFTACLPLAAAEAASQERQPRSHPSQEGDEMILIIDDEEMVRDTAARILRRQGYTVLEAEDGERGLALYERHGDEIQLILLDHSMPRLSGRQVLTELRGRGTRAKVVIITGVATGLQDFEDADDLLEKPFSLNSLVGRVREILDQP